MTRSDETAALVEELRAAAHAFTRDEASAMEVLGTMAEDVQRAMAQPIDIFPVIHHSPASALQMVRYLRTRQSKLVFVELCEDLRPVVEHLRDCTLPVALQAFAGEPVGFPDSWSPLSLVAPLTELSAEYQAIAYALSTEDVELVFVDRSVDHVFQWRDPSDDPDAPAHDDFDEYDDQDDETARLHGDSLGVEVGGVVPTFADFREFLLRNARMSHFSEWTSLYIEQPTLHCDTVAYREVLCMVGSLFRRLGSTPHHREEIRRRDRYMWTRIKQELATRQVDPGDAVFVCGAAHAVDDETPEWGLDNERTWESISPRSETSWQYGLIPSSYGAIEMQFGHPRGAVSLAETEWKKALRSAKLTSFSLAPSGKKATGKKRKSSAKATARRASAVPEQLSLRSLLRDAPALTDTDRTELVKWCTGIVSLSRRHRYMASTADAIAIYETAILLARMRARNRPSPYDFVDAAETCLEKTRVPGRRNVRQLCHRLLGGDRMGQVGYDSLPPLVRDVYDRLQIVGITAETRTMKRVLMDFDRQPELRQVSKLLWRLHWLLPDTRVARPIMGELVLGSAPRQESWDVRLSGPEQRAVIELSFKGISVEQVLERRLHETAFEADATTVDALEAAEVCSLLLERTRLFDVLGHQAVVLLAREVGAEHAPGIFDRVRRLVHHFRATPAGLPSWLEELVATGYAHYATQLPTAFADRGTSPEQVAAMLGFVFTLESLALTVGCSRSQLMIALEQSVPGCTDPEKLGLLWAAEWAVQTRDEAQVRAAFETILLHPLGRAAYPRYLGGFVRALSFVPGAASLTVSLLGRAFATLPDGVLLPWLPGLLATLQPLAGGALTAMFKEFLADLPRTYAGLPQWSPAWERAAVGKGSGRQEVSTAAAPSPAPSRSPVGLFVAAHVDAGCAWASALGVEGAVAAPLTAEQEPAPGAVARWLAQNPASAQAWAEALFEGD